MTPPPVDTEAEGCVLGAILLSASCLQGLLDDGLCAEHFWLDRHRVIFQAMVDMRAEHRSVDVVTLTAFLRQRCWLEAAGGRAGVDELTGGVPFVGAVREYARIVMELAEWRAIHGMALAILDAVECLDRSAYEAALLLPMNGRLEGSYGADH